MSLEPGKRIKYWRELKSITQTDLAARAKMDKTKLCRIESGELNARASDIELLARCMDMSMPEFYGAVAEVGGKSEVA